MTKQKQIYKCFVCGNIVEVLHPGAGELVCCNEPMKLMEEKQQEDQEIEEKHVPVIQELPSNDCLGKDGFKVKIGEVEHPMQENHYIEWIEVNTVEGKSGKKFLKPGDEPESIFQTRVDLKKVRAYCNVHGLWSFENN